MPSEKEDITAAASAIQNVSKDNRRDWLKEVIERIRGVFDTNDAHVVNEVLRESFKGEERAFTNLNHAINNFKQNMEQLAKEWKKRIEVLDVEYK